MRVLAGIVYGVALSIIAPSPTQATEHYPGHFNEAVQLDISQVRAG